MIRFIAMKRGLVLASLVLLCAVWIRLTAYGDLRLSVATMDTPSYMLSARAPVFAWSSFTGERLFTTNLFYKIEGAENCTIEVMSIPAIGKESPRRVQPCLEGIVLAQSILSVLGWGFFIWSFSSIQRHGFSQVASAIILSAFAFTPQIADWDSILSSESLTFSLFALSVGLVLQILVRYDNVSGGSGTRKSFILLAAGAALTLALWALVRDINIYVLLLFCLMAIPFLFLRKPRPVLFTTSIVALLAVSILGLVSSYQSRRWKTPLTNAFEEYVLPHPARMEFFQRLGMPSPDTARYQDWFDRSGTQSYLLFLATHPGFVTTTIFDHISSLFANNNQPYYKAAEIRARTTALNVGDVVHSKSGSSILIDLLLVLVLGLVAFRDRNPCIIARSWFLVWLLISAIATLILSFFSDAIGVERHVLFSLVLFRLIVWLALLIFVDLVPGDPHELAVA